MNGYNVGPSPIRDLLLEHLMEGQKREGVVRQTLMDALMGEALLRSRPSEIAGTKLREEQADLYAEDRQSLIRQRQARTTEIETLLPERLNLIGAQATLTGERAQTEEALRQPKVDTILSRIANDAVNRAYTVARTKTVEDLRDPSVQVMMERAALLQMQTELTDAKIATEDQLRDPRMRDLMQRTATNAARTKLVEAQTALTGEKAETEQVLREPRKEAVEARTAAQQVTTSRTEQQIDIAEEQRQYDLDLKKAQAEWLRRRNAGGPVGDSPLRQMQFYEAQIKTLMNELPTGVSDTHARALLSRIESLMTQPPAVAEALRPVIDGDPALVANPDLKVRLYDLAKSRPTFRTTPAATQAGKTITVTKQALREALLKRGIDPDTGKPLNGKAQ